MNNKRKAVGIAGIILILTLGVALIKIYLYPAEGFYYIGPGMLLLLPALPFIWIVGLLDNNLGLATTLIFTLSTAFWLSIAYAIGAYLDRKNK